MLCNKNYHSTLWLTSTAVETPVIVERSKMFREAVQKELPDIALIVPDFGDSIYEDQSVIPTKYNDASSEFLGKSMSTTKG